MGDRREKVFLMTKIDGRDAKTATQQIDESLRLQTDHLDLLQFHEVIRMNDPGRAALLSKTAEVAKNGEFEKYKTSTMFDDTNHNPQWLR